MTKKKSSEIFGRKMEIFSWKNVIQVRENLFVPPKLGARSPPLAGRVASGVGLHFICKDVARYVPVIGMSPMRRTAVRKTRSRRPRRTAGRQTCLCLSRCSFYFCLSLCIHLSNHLSLIRLFILDIYRL